MGRPRKNKSDDAPALTPKKERAKIAKPIRKPEPEIVEEEEPKHRTKSVVPPEIKKTYGPEANCGDVLAKLLDGIEFEQLPKLAKKLGITWPWSHLNKGMQRMNFGNVLRKFINSENGKEFLKQLKDEIDEITGVAK